jgi:orotidine-5'-phosphate decarboxylase
VTTPASPVIVALDCPDAAAALALARRLDPSACRVKVGKELFVAAGPRLVDDLQGLGFELFLDLKFHDIPNTVAAAVRRAAELGVWMVNVHASGGRRMLEASVAALADRRAVPRLIGVTVLTSMEASDFAELGVQRSIEEQVLYLAEMCADCGLDGVVCSAREAAALRARLPATFQLVTPGIRPAGSARDDQRRVVTPVDALRDGSDYLVIGRPITAADDPAAALAAINQSIGF